MGSLVELAGEIVAAQAPTTKKAFLDLSGKAFYFLFYLATD